MILLVTILLTTAVPAACAFGPQSPLSHHKRPTTIIQMSDNWQNNPTGSDANQWRSMDDDYAQQEQDWQDVLSRKQDGSFWSDFESTDEDTMDDLTNQLKESKDDETNMVDDADAWLNTLASISAEEVEFNMAEASLADKAREMQEWGFDAKTIENTFGIAVDDSLEKDEVEGMQVYRDTSYWDDEDWKTVESHTKVEKDDETGEPIRQQMVGLSS